MWIFRGLLKGRRCVECEEPPSADEVRHGHVRVDSGGRVYHKRCIDRRKRREK